MIILFDGGVSIILIILCYLCLYMWGNPFHWVPHAYGRFCGLYSELAVRGGKDF
jgi:hypothetical protein